MLFCISFFSENDAKIMFLQNLTQYKLKMHRYFGNLRHAHSNSYLYNRRKILQLFPC